MKKLVFYLFFYISSNTNIFAGGAWIPEKGEGLIIVSQRSISGNFYFSGSGEIIESPNFSILTTNFYGEYGLSNKLAIILYSPFLTYASQSEGIDGKGNRYDADNALGFGDLDLGLKYNFYNKKFVVSTSLYLGIPSGNYKAGNTKHLHLGDGDFSQLIRLDLSKAFNKSYFNFYGGFNNRTNGFSEDIQAGAEIGRRKGSFIYILKVDSRTSLYNGQKPETKSFGIYSNNLEYMGITPQIIYEYKKIAFLAEVGFAASGKNIIASPSFNLGVLFNIKKKNKI